MKKLLILLLIVGCEEAGLNTESLTDSTSVTDTLYVVNYDTLIVTNNDTLIVTNYDTTIVYDTTFAIDTIYIETDNDEIFNVDWILVKNPNGSYSHQGTQPTIINTTLIILSTDSSRILDSIDFGGYNECCPSIENDNLIFNYNGEEFSYDISDFYSEEHVCDYVINFAFYTIYPKSFERIIYNRDENYIMIFDINQSIYHPYFINIESMEVIDYR